MSADLSLLDNPVWNALGTRQRRFAFGTGPARKFPREVLPFMATSEDDYRLLDHLLPVMRPGEEVFIKEAAGEIPLPWEAVSSVACLQMVCPAPLPPSSVPTAGAPRMLTERDNEELIALVNMVQPGYFREETFLLGDYYGIRDKDRLVAVAGQRLQMPGLVEISAVCTHPDHTGKGYAQTLIARLCANIFEAGDMPFLHVAGANIRAIELYKHLGFHTRRDIGFVKLKFPAV